MLIIIIKWHRTECQHGLGLAVTPRIFNGSNLHVWKIETVNLWADDIVDSTTLQRGKVLIEFKQKVQLRFLHVP